LGTVELVTTPEAPKKRSWGKILLVLANLGALALMVRFLRELDWNALGEDLEKLHWGWVAAAVVTDILVYVLQSWRWSLLLRPLKEKLRFFDFLRAIYTGLLANEILPFKPGEVIRCFMISRWTKLPFPVTLSSFVIERVIDGFWLLLCLAISLQIMDLPGWIQQASWIIGILIVVGTGLLIFVTKSRDRVRARFSRNRFLRQILVVADDLAVVGPSKFLYYSILVSLPYLLLQVLPIYFLGLAYGIDPFLTLPRSFALMVLLRLSGAAPQAPGNLGIYQEVAKNLVINMGADASIAARFAFVLWIVITIPLSVAGLLALVLSGMNLGSLQKEAEAELSGPGEPLRSGS
jgi:glycosyltransferase 2 family protein